jgi:hypothetical protein
MDFIQDVILLNLILGGRGGVLMSWLHCMIDQRGMSAKVLKMLRLENGIHVSLSHSFRLRRCRIFLIGVDCRFLDTVKKMGVPYVEDINDPQQPTSSLTKLRTTVTADGKRCSAYEAFLSESFVKSHPNLRICFGAVVQRLDIILYEGNNKIEGVFVESEGSSRETFYVKAKEVILCAGAVASPQILLLRYFTHYCSNSQWHRIQRGSI